MICSLFNFCPHSAQSRRHEGALVGLAPQREIWNTINQWRFVNFQKQAPPHKRKAPLFKFSSDGSESAAYSSFVHKKPNLTQMKQEFKCLRAQWHDQTKIVDGSKYLILGEQEYFVWDTAS